MIVLKVINLVHRIHLILMFRNQVPHWKKIDPDPGPNQFFKIHWYNKIWIYFSILFMPIDVPFGDEDIFKYLPFFQ